MRFTASIRILSLLSAGLALAVGTALAQVGSPISTCPATCNSDCYLHTNVQCTDGNGITLNSGADLDMFGHSVECVITPGSNETCTTPAISMAASNSRVRNTHGSLEGVIFGPWRTGIACNSKTASKVDGIRIEGIGNALLVAAATGILNCAQVEHNVLVGGGVGRPMTAISTSGIANSDYIRDNYIDGWISTAITVTGDKGISIDHNMIILHENTQSPGLQLGVYLNATSSSLSAENNVFAGELGVIFLVSGSSSASYASNICDPTLIGSVGGCASCISDGRCEDPTAPFTLP